MLYVLLLRNYMEKSKQMEVPNVGGLISCREELICPGDRLINEHLLFNMQEHPTIQDYICHQAGEVMGQ